MPSEYTISILDYSKESSSMRVKVPTVDSINFDDTVTAVTALRNAVGGITLGNISQDKLIAYSTFITRAPATDKAAQRESKWLARYEDNVNHKIFTNEIPTADQSLLTGNSDLITAFPVGVLATFKTAFEAAIVSPYDNAVTLLSLEFIGKRL